MKKKDEIIEILSCFPPELYGEIEKTLSYYQVEEIRLRAKQKPRIRMCGKETEFSSIIITAEMLRDILSRAARYSVHSYAESLKNGFITLAGGHRLGICGSAVLEDGQVSGIRAISSINLRIARQPDWNIAPASMLQNGKLASTLILAPPGLGKTTLLRNMIADIAKSGKTVSVIDERCEIAALREGSPQFEIGGSTDVLEGCSKKQAAIMLLKTMSPDVLAFDEITAPEDVEAVSLCAHCGIEVLASAHAASIEDLKRRVLYQKLLSLKLFQQIVTIRLVDGKRIYETEGMEV